MEIRSFWVDVEDANGAKVGRGPLRASRFTRRSVLSASGEFSFTCSPADPNFSALQEKRTVRCRYIDMSGVVHDLGGGVVDKITYTLQNGTVLVDVSGNDECTELGYRSVGSLTLASGSSGVLNAPDLVMALAPAGWSIVDGDVTQNTVYAGFDGESVLNAMVKIGEHIGEHWRLSDTREITWIGKVADFPASGKRAVQHINDPAGFGGLSNLVIITKLTEQRDATQLISRVIPRGSGNGSAILTLATVSESAPSGYTLDTANNYLKRNDTETAYGRIEKALDFKEIGPLSNTTADIQAASNMLLQACYEHLRRYGTVSKFYSLEVISPSLLQVGTTIRVIYRQLMDGAAVVDIDGTLNIIGVEHTVNENGLYTSRIDVSTIDRLPMTDEQYLAGQMQGAKVLSTHPQLGPSVDTMTWRDEMDDEYDASFRFWLGDEYTSIERALLRFKIRPLRSTVKSVAGSSTTSGSGGGSTATSGGGGGTTVSSGQSAAGTPVGGTHSHAALNLVGGGHSHATNNHSHDVTISSHTHSVDIPSHTHSVTPNVSMTYGIFEQTSGNTLVLADLVIALNGGSDLSGAVESLSGGWYELDITDALVDSVFRPTQESNELVISTSVAKTARIEAQLTIRGVVQAVKYE